MRDWLVDNEPDWTEAFTRPSRYVGGDANLYQTVQAPWPSAEGYRVIRCRSSAKIDHDAETRRSQVAAGIAAIDEFNQRLLTPKTRLKDVVAIESAARDALEATSSSRWVRFELHEREEVACARRPGGDPAPTPATGASPGFATT